MAELNVWRPPPEQIAGQLAAGRLLTVEADAFHLPGTVGTSYRARHQKTTVAMTAVDREARHLCYFHDTGHHTLAGDDYDGLPAWGEAVADRPP